MNYKSIISVFCLLGAGITAAGQTVVTDTLGFEKAVSQSPATLIKGQVSGVRVSSLDGGTNSAINTNIRGLNSLRSDSQPTWIVNGVVLATGLNQNLNAFWQEGGTTSKGTLRPDYTEESYTAALNSLNFINPYDIESIEVIKDMSAAALYGTLGANGVIIVKTRLPKSGERNISWNSNVSADFANRTGDAFRTGISHNHTVGVNGFVNNTAYNLSGFFRSTNGVAKRSGSNAGGLNVSLETRANSIFWFGLNSTLFVGGQSNASGAAYLNKPSTMIVSRYPGRFSGDTVEGWEADYDDDVEDYRAVSSVWLNINFTKSLVLKTSIGIDFENNNRRIWYGNGTSFGKKYSGAASLLSSTLFNYNAKADLAFNRYFAGKHHLTADLAVEAVGSKNRFGVMNGTTFDLPYLRAHGLSSMGSTAFPYKFSRDYSNVGAYARLSYDYNGFFGLDAMYRADFTAKYTGSKPMSYPSANAFVDFRKMLLPSSEAVSTLKLVGGYGCAGREEYSPYELLGNFITDIPDILSGTSQFYDGVNRLYSAEWNAGVQLGFAGGRANLDVKYYDKRTDDTYNIYYFGKVAGEYIVWANSGESVWEHSGSIRNNGIEFDFDGRIIDSSNWTWTIYGNAANNLNRITSIGYEEICGRKVGNGIYATINSVGRSVSSLFGFEDSASGAYIDKNGDGRYTDADKVILGNTLPKWSGALGTTLRWRDLTFDARFDGASDFQIANLNKMIAESRTKLSSRFVEDGDYLRLSRVSLSYRIPVGWKWLKSLKLSASGNNLLTFTKYSGWNPDVNCFGNTARSNGIDYGSYPAVRSVVFGVSANF